MKPPIQPDDPRLTRWRSFRYSLRTLLVVVTLVSVGLGIAVSRAQRQRRAVAAIQAAGGTVAYDYEQRTAHWVEGELPGPDWLCRLLGVDYFADVTHAELPTGATDETVAHLSGLANFQHLNLGYTQVSDAGLAHLSGLRCLQELWLSGTQVSDAGLSHLSSMTDLQELWLSNTQVRDGGLAHLSGLASLRELHLDRTQVSDAGYDRLERALPSCAIVRYAPGWGN